MTLVSVITVVKDDEKGLVATYSSLMEQIFQDWEVIIVVGASKDSTLSIAFELQAKDQRIHVFEEKGKGIYGAMNEGLEVAKGKFVWFMNAGDRFAGSLVLSNAVEEIETAKAGVVVGGYGVNGKARDTKFQFSSKTLSAITFAFNRHGGCHQAMIFRTTSLRKVGCFDTSYTLASDFKAILGVIRTAGASRANALYALIEPGGLADQGIFVVHKEKHRIRKEVFGNPVVTFMSLLWTLAAQSKIKIRRRLESQMVKGRQ